MNKSYVAFYPSKKYWAVSSIDVDDPVIQENLHKYMEEIVFQHHHEEFELAICRDGRIMLSLKETGEQDDYDFAGHILRWNTYLKFINSFYLILYSVISEQLHHEIISLHEITNRDAFPTTFLNGNFQSEGMATESLASYFQMARYFQYQNINMPLRLHDYFRDREVIDEGVFNLASIKFERLFYRPGLEKLTFLISKSISEYKVGNFDNSIISSWFCSEKTLSNMWQEFLQTFNDPDETIKRVNSRRMKKLNDSDYTISIITNQLELFGKIPFELYEKLEKVRVARNKIAHGDYKYQPSRNDSALAIISALELLALSDDIHLAPSLSLQITCIN